MLRTVLPLHNSRKLALRFFQTEQRKNTNLHGLSAVQKKKVILKMFKQLTREDMDALKKRAAAWEAKKISGETAIPSYRRRNEITPYELFYKEQLSNPSIASIASPSVREKKLFAIFNSLPVATMEALEKRARELSQGIALSDSPPPSGKKPSASKKKKKRITIKTSSKSRSMTSQGASVRKKKKRTVTKTKVSPYAAFVKEQMPHMTHLPTKERMKAIAEKWNSMKTENAVDKSKPENAVDKSKPENTAAADPAPPS
ncbi:hypothetical protein C3747_33g118 [Trypanosoma cruzi]|uniref:Kinetoplast DNA-associated protein n=1 Tax=Trypanosoma cruzi TaxID=5693 RepID=A0A2V2X1W6_TRYCR|nr:hypothetical protein C3747_33g118 [Trypanosoma cruzi]RNC60734.1 hypothetical protein TcCL_ESM01557 [Trypanosoma cruzi]